jgi:hypothetical protein
MISPLSSYALVTSFVIILKALFHSCFQDWAIPAALTNYHGFFLRKPRNY